MNLFSCWFFISLVSNVVFLFHWERRICLVLIWSLENFVDLLDFASFVRK